MMQQHEAKLNPIEKDETVIVEAFGARKCPKLVEQVQSEKLAVKRNALAVLCSEFSNPMSIRGCVEAGIMQVLCDYIAGDADDLTRERASQALALAAWDANGRVAMLDEGVAAKIMPALDDAVVVVRRNVLEALVNYSCATIREVRSIVGAGYPTTLVAKAASEVDEVQPLVLKLLYNCIKDETGLADALGASAVETCISLLDSGSTEVRKESATTLSFLCFAEMAKMNAIQGGGVAKLSSLLTDEAWEVRAAAAGALMAVTTTDPGKKAIVPANGVEPLINLLQDEQRLVKLNVLKTMANVAVNPDVREQLKMSESVLPTLSALIEGEDTLLAKHASIAKAAVLWEP